MFKIVVAALLSLLVLLVVAEEGERARRLGEDGAERDLQLIGLPLLR
jgi:hypothetical protein